MPDNTVTIPKTAAAARKQIVQIDSAEVAGKWHKAAICYAYRAKHYDELGDARRSAKAASDELATDGYGEWTITTYANRWAEAKQADIRPGDQIKIPKISWDSITGGHVPAAQDVTSTTVKNVVEAAKSDPEIAEALTGKIAENEDLDTEMRVQQVKTTEKKKAEKKVEKKAKKEVQEAAEELAAKDPAQPLYDILSDAIGRVMVAGDLASGIMEDHPDSIDVQLIETKVSMIRNHVDTLEMIIRRTDGWDAALAGLIEQMSGDNSDNYNR